MCAGPACAGRQPDSADAVQAESLQLLDWRALCAQVAAFAATPLAAEPLLRGELRLGAAQVLGSFLPFFCFPLDMAKQHLPMLNA
jgi:hypothetical protein